MAEKLPTTHEIIDASANPLEFADKVLDSDYQDNLTKQSAHRALMEEWVDGSVENAEDNKAYFNEQPVKNEDGSLYDSNLDKNIPAEKIKDYLKDRRFIRSQMAAEEKYDAEDEDYQVIDESNTLDQLISLYAYAERKGEDGKKSWIFKLAQDKLAQGEIGTVSLTELTNKYTAAEILGSEDTKSLVDTLIEAKSEEERNGDAPNRHVSARENYKRHVNKMIAASRKRLAEANDDLDPDEEWVTVPDGPRKSIPGQDDDYQPMKRVRRTKTPAQESTDEVADARQNVEDALNPDADKADEPAAPEPESHNDPAPEADPEDDAKPEEETTPATEDTTEEQAVIPARVANTVTRRMTTPTRVRPPVAAQPQRSRLSRLFRREKVDMDTAERKLEKRSERYGRQASTINTLGGMAFGIAPRDGLGIFENSTRSRSENTSEYQRLGGNSIQETFKPKDDHEEPKPGYYARAKKAVSERREKRAIEKAPKFTPISADKLRRLGGSEQEARRNQQLNQEPGDDEEELDKAA
jgi:hypothetical protein